MYGTTVNVRNKYETFQNLKSNKKKHNMRIIKDRQIMFDILVKFCESFLYIITNIAYINEKKKSHSRTKKTRNG